MFGKCTKSLQPAIYGWSIYTPIIENCQKHTIHCEVDYPAGLSHKINRKCSVNECSQTKIDKEFKSILAVIWNCFGLFDGLDSGNGSRSRLVIDFSITTMFVPFKYMVTQTDEYKVFILIGTEYWSMQQKTPKETKETNKKLLIV